MYHLRIILICILLCILIIVTQKEKFTSCANPLIKWWHNTTTTGGVQGANQAQIDKSFDLFKKKANIKLKHYSYPEGQKVDFNESIIKILKKKKILLCPSAISGVNHFMTDFFKLKRIMLLKMKRL